MYEGAEPVVQRAQPPRPAGSEEDALVVVSANLWHDWPRHRRLPERLESFARLVEREGAQVVLLQEVARTRDLYVDSWLADRLGMAYVYTRVNGHEDSLGFEEGLAVLSRFPLVASKKLELKPSVKPFMRRMALGAQLTVGDVDLWFVSTHLSLLHWFNASQLPQLHQWVANLSTSRPAIIGGDFNAGERSSQIHHARERWLDPFRMLHPYADGATHTFRFPCMLGRRKRRLDYIFFHPGERTWNVQEARHLTAPLERHSDHLAVMVRVAPGTNPA
jgi:endonuclease/exonuclease/phosphatase family metal-dependent hydrolase